MRNALPILIVLLLLLAGCVSSSGPTASPSDPTTTIDETSDDNSSLDLSSSGISCQETLSVSFWGRNDPGLWDQNTVRVGYTVPPNTSFFVVTYVDGSIEGVTYENNTANSAVATDGAELHLDSKFSGKHTVQVVVHSDQDGNGEFNEEIDHACLANGEVVQAGPEQIDFNSFN